MMDLDARIARARGCLLYADRCESDIAKQIATLQKGKARLLGIAPFAKSARVAQANKSIVLAESRLAAAAKSARALRESANDVMQALLAEGVSQ
jgi:hypothetical protein